MSKHLAKPRNLGHTINTKAKPNPYHDDNLHTSGRDTLCPKQTFAQDVGAHETRSSALHRLKQQTCILQIIEKVHHQWGSFGSTGWKRSQQLIPVIEPRVTDLLCVHAERWNCLDMQRQTQGNVTFIADRPLVYSVYLDSGGVFISQCAARTWDMRGGRTDKDSRWAQMLEIGVRKHRTTVRIIPTLKYQLLMSLLHNRDLTCLLETLNFPFCTTIIFKVTGSKLINL